MEEEARLSCGRMLGRTPDPLVPQANGTVVLPSFAPEPALVEGRAPAPLDRGPAHLDSETEPPCACERAEAALATTVATAEGTGSRGAPTGGRNCTFFLPSPLLPASAPLPSGFKHPVLLPVPCRSESTLLATSGPKGALACASWCSRGPIAASEAGSSAASPFTGPAQAPSTPTDAPCALALPVALSDPLNAGSLPSAIAAASRAELTGA